MKKKARTERSSDSLPQTLVCPACSNTLRVFVEPTTTSNGWTNAWCYRSIEHDRSEPVRLRVAKP